ncbi:FAD-dependent oxidoreductase [Kitasatospora sp. NPDC054939]
MTSTRPVVVLGAGPYGLAVSAHLAARRLPVLTLGATMEGWRRWMPRGMYLKSTPRASNISDPEATHGYLAYRAAHGLPPVGDRYAIPLAEFVRYGDWFRDQRVPATEPRRARTVGHGAGGPRVTLDDGEEIAASAVVVAIGQRAFAYVPETFDALRPTGAVTHTCEHDDLTSFAGQRVAVVGAGQSALESAALLAEAGATPTLVARTPRLLFGDPPDIDRPGDRPLAARLRTPASDLGPGWPLYTYSHLAGAFRHLPDDARRRKVRTVLGPAGAWWLRERVEGRLDIRTGTAVTAAKTANGEVRLELSVGGDPLEVDHVLAATGYRIDVAALDLLTEGVRHALRRAPTGAPRLSRGFESSVPGLYFTGLTAADTFGPPMRFVCGTRFAAPRIAAAIEAAAR